MTTLLKPTWAHAGSRFMCVTQNVIEELQTAFFNALRLENVIPDIDGETAAVIVAESLEADRIWNFLLQGNLSELDNIRSGTKSDYKKASAAELLFQASEAARKISGQEQAEEFWALAMAILENIARSPVASPMLWYEDIFDELGFRSLPHNPREALDWFKRELIHSLHFNNSDNSHQILRSISEACLTTGELELGLQILLRLLQIAPNDIWNYNIMAISFEKFGLTQLGKQAAQRGLQLLDAIGDPDHLRKQFEKSISDMQNSKQKGREAEVSATMIESFQNALELALDAGQPYPTKELCYELLPDLVKIPVKQPMKPADINLPDRDEIYRELSSASGVQETKKKTHRGRRKSNRH